VLAEIFRPSAKEQHTVTATLPPLFADYRKQGEYDDLTKRLKKNCKFYLLSDNSTVRLVINPKVSQTGPKVNIWQE
jgi:hypothetical protein